MLLPKSVLSRFFLFVAALLGWLTVLYLYSHWKTQSLDMARRVEWLRGYPILVDKGDTLRLVTFNGLTVSEAIAGATRSAGPAYQYFFFTQPSGDWPLGNGQWLPELRRLVWMDQTGKIKKSYWWLPAGQLWPLGGGETACPLAIRPDNVSTPSTTGSGESPLTTDELRSDMALLSNLLCRQYAYWDTEHERLLHGFKFEIENQLSQGTGISRIDFALSVERLLAGLGDLHTHVVWQRSKLEISAIQMPFNLHKIQGKWVATSLSDVALYDARHPWMESVQGVSVDTLIRRLRPLCTQSGTDTASYWEAVQWLTKRPVLAFRYLGLPLDAKELPFQLKSNTGQSFSTAAAFSTKSAWEYNRQAPMITTQWLPDSIGYLALRYELPHTDAYKIQLRRSLVELQHAKQLILDLRGNAGGSREVAMYVARSLLPLEKDRLINVATYRMPPANRPDADVPLLAARLLYPVQYYLRDTAKQTIIRRFEADHAPRMGMLLAEYAAPHYAFLADTPTLPQHHPPTDIVIIQDQRTASAANLLATWLRDFGASCTLIGERTTGGSGYPVEFCLPESGVCFQLSMMASYNREGLPFRGLVPDVEIQPSFGEWQQQMRATRDVQVNAAIKICRNKAKAGESTVRTERYR